MSATQRPPATEARKVVTALFSDVTGSTVLGQELDPESLRRIMSRYFEEMKSVVERHGGTVEKFIGDAVMAVFGVPLLHEDDALRAVRAGVDMRDALQRLNDEFEQTWGVRIATRTGVNTGEVMAGAPGRGESLVIGDAVNVAARLEQAAQPGEILVGENTYRLVRDAVVAEEVDPLALKGIARPVPAWRLLRVVPGAPGWTRRLDSPLVGRDAELGALSEIFHRSVHTGTCEVVSLMGPAGVGKSRLAGEFISAVAPRATVVTGRCLPYGEGITFWPIIEVLQDAAGISERDSEEDARAKISQMLPPGEESALIVDRLAALLGIAERTPNIQETFWGVRKLFEGLGERQPVVVIFDEIQWAEPTFLDLLEYLAASIRRGPVLIVCLSRPEILDSRPAWMSGERTNASVITLQPLGESEIDGLIRNLVGGTELPSEAREHIAEVAEGNPLFIEEILRMLVDDGLLQSVDGRWNVVKDLSRIPIPPTIHALLTARLDRLDTDERAVIERASIVGRIFWWAAVSALSPEELRPEIGSNLQSLMRKELIRPDLSSLREEDAYRFAHILVRDAAYRAIPKAVRAELHERLAEWTELRTKHRAAEYEEILGYHLEQAYRLLLELGTVRQNIEPLGRRAAVPLASAGQRAFTRGDMPAAVNLLTRVASLLPEDDSQRLDLMPQLAFALMETGDFGRLQAVVAEISEAATASADAGLQANALILGLWIRLFTNPEGWAEVAQSEATRAIATFQEIGDERGLARGWSLLGLVHSMRAQFARAEEAWEHAAAHAHKAREHRDELENLSWVPLTVWAGPTPAEQGLQRCREVLERAAGDKKPMATALFMQAPFEAGLGRFDEARELIVRARSVLQDVALTVWIAGPLTQISGWVELTAGDPAAAERELRWGYKTLSDIGEYSWLSTTVAILAEAVYEQHRYEEAEELTKVSEQTAGSDDAYSQVLWRSVRGKALAARGEAGDAERLVAQAVALTEPTDFLHLRGYALMSRAEVLQLAERAGDAVPSATEAARLFKQKGNVVAAARAERLLEELQTSLKSGEAET